VRHITDPRLDELEPLLVRVRKIEGLTERKRGVFYRKSRAFLHFHEDPAGLFVDVRLGSADFDRFEVTGRRAQSELVKRIRAALA